MGNVLMIAEHKDGTLRKVNLPGFHFAKEYTKKRGGEFHILIIGHNVANVAEQARCFGASKIHLADRPELASYLAESHALVAVKVAKDMNAEVIGACTSAMTKDLMPRIAGKLDAGMASDILSFDDKGWFKRPVWAGNAVAAVEITSPVKVVTIRATEFDAAPKGSPAGEVVKVDVQIDFASLKKRFVKFEAVKSDRPELTEAAVIVTGGRGTKGPEGFKLLEGLADQFNAAIGATRAAVDAGWVPNDLQVGQTGKVVAPNVYFAVGVSGAIQHLAGMKGSKVIVAINKDEEAPIFNVSDYGLVADLFKAVPELVEEIKKAKNA